MIRWPHGNRLTERPLEVCLQFRALQESMIAYVRNGEVVRTAAELGWITLTVNTLRPIGGAQALGITALCASESLVR